jgi:ABC-type phosphate/phosphonate transport system ATPase subunit
MSMYVDSPLATINTLLLSVNERTRGFWHDEGHRSPGPGYRQERFWLRRIRVKLRRESIGFVFQQFYLMPTLTAGENI